MTTETHENTPSFSFTKIIAAVIFLTTGIALSFVAPSIEIAWIIGILLLTVYLFAFEVVDVDIAAITIMVLLGLTLFPFMSSIMGLSSGLVKPEALFTGFSSNAVISIIAVMIIGAGLDKTGMMSSVASFILRVGGKTETRVIPIVSSTVGIISSFMQNVGAAALFLPVVSRISSRSGLPMSRLLMPMGFCAILGGTVTMIGSSPLILLNSLLKDTNKTLPQEQQMELWGMFAVTPIGLVLVFAGILYFVIAGKFVLPNSKEEKTTKNKNIMQDVYGVNYELREVTVPNNSSLIGKHFDDVETTYKVRIIATHSTKNKNTNALHRDSEISSGQILAVLADIENITEFSNKYNLQVTNPNVFSESLSSSKAGIAEIVIPPSSSLIGKSARDIWMRKTTGLAMVGLHRDGKTMHEGEDIRSIPFKSGDTMIVHTSWDTLAHTEKNKDFLIVTSDYPKEESRPNKVVPALFFLILALVLIFIKTPQVPLSVALLTGALGMILSGVLKIDEAYNAVSWKTVFLLASLLPLGLAVQDTGTAEWIAKQTVLVVGDMPNWGIQTVIAILATLFTLVISNIGATVLLVPIAINVALEIGANPAVFALTVALATSNSFLIPTHQVNALIMGPGGYKVADYLKAGGIMTILFLVILIPMLNLIF